MPRILRETAAALEYRPAPDTGVPWPWNVPDGQWTWELYCQLPEGDGYRYEVIGGRLVVSPSPGEIHQRVVHNCNYILGEWVRRTKAGRVYSAPFDVILSSVLAKAGYAEPDLLFISKGRLAIITSKNVQGAPDLVIEIVSPSTGRNDWMDKRIAYESAGVAHYWVVDPADYSLTVYRLKDGKYDMGSRFENDATFEPEGFSGLTINLAEVWE